MIVDAKAVLFLLGTELDFKTDRFSSTFVFNNPNQVSACGGRIGRERRAKARSPPNRSRMDAEGIREIFAGVAAGARAQYVWRPRHL